MKIATVCCALLLMTPGLVGAGSPTILELWPNKPPGETGVIGEEKYLTSRPEELCQKKLTNVSKPTIAIYRPTKVKDTGAVVVIAPGGGYHILAEDLEGEEVADWLNSIGVTAIVLKYRVPRRADQPKNEPPIGALQDAQRAISMVRSKAKSLGIDGRRIGLLGFSAGGHLTAWTSTNSDRRSYPSIDEIDQSSCRPDFSILIYPAYLQKPGLMELQETVRVSANAPPSFLVHAADDPLSYENSIAFYKALVRLGVPAELHVYAKGGHGFGLRPSPNPCSTWPKRCEEWMKSRGLLKPTS